MMNTNAVYIDERLKKLIRRSRELVAEGQEIERLLKDVDRQIVEHGIESEFVERRLNSWRSQKLTSWLLIPRC
jgi:hypothetical protein